MVEIRLEKLAETNALLQRTLFILEDLEDVYEKWADFYRTDIISTTWQTQGAMQGKRWKELSPKYKAWKEKNYPGMPKLILTNRMLMAALGGEGGFTHITKRKLEMGIDVNQIPYARIHQEGGHTGRAYIPQRPYFYMADGTITGRAIQKLKNLILNKLDKVIK